MLEKDLTFIPATNVVKGDETTTGETNRQGDVFERLTSSRQYVQEVLSKIKEDMELANCTFKPQLPIKSEKLGLLC